MQNRCTLRLLCWLVLAQHLTKPSNCCHLLSTTMGIKSSSVFATVRSYLQASCRATHLPLDSTHACTLGVHRLVGEPETCVHMLYVANGVAIFNVGYAHAVHLFPRAEIELLLWFQCGEERETNGESHNRAQIRTILFTAQFSGSTCQ